MPTFIPTNGKIRDPSTQYSPQSLTGSTAESGQITMKVITSAHRSLETARKLCARETSLMYTYTACLIVVSRVH